MAVTGSLVCYNGLPVSKSARIREMVSEFEGQALDARYLAFFQCFNHQLFFEAHEVLEDLWLQQEGQNYRFYKGLIQFAGAFVHLQKGRLRPAAALLRLAISNLEIYPVLHERLDTSVVVKVMADWLLKLEKSDYLENPLVAEAPPLLRLS